MAGGFGLFYLAAVEVLTVPLPVVGAVFGLLLVAAGVVTAVHTSRVAVGVRVESSTAGAMYGSAWLIGSVSLPPIVLGAGRAGASEDVLDLL